ncbi:hypothetical protein C8Q79DRAFT_900682 [Trametes meyenii]|nr:hypothetical protein C8Q79DRAFT_900682 [Trametes meyenii]
MSHAAFRDRYTALPPRVRTRRRARSQEPPCAAAESHTPDTCVSRGDLLHKLAGSITEERKAIESLLLTFGLDDDLATRGLLVSDIDRIRLRPSNNPLSNDAWGDSFEITDKNQYLLTPIRMRLFPKASPGVLRNLLSTPSLRAFTPDQSILPEDSSLLGSPLQGLATTDFLPANVEPLSSRKGLPDAEPAMISGSATLPRRTSTFLLPSPPPSAELPGVESFHPPNVAAESSPIAGLDRNESERTDPSVDNRGSSRRPFPELIPSGLRAAPCSPLLTTRSVVDDTSSPLSSVTAARGPRPSDPWMHTYRGLAFGVVRDFQRVLNELQGLGHETSTPGADTEQQAPPQSIRASSSPEDKSLNLQCRTSLRPIGIYGAAALPTLSRSDGEKKASGADSSFDRPVSGGRGLLGPGSGPPLRQMSAQPSCAPSTSFSGLEDEFIGLLLGQAAEEETQARRLQEIAAELHKIAQSKRVLADTMTKRQL